MIISLWVFFCRWALVRGLMSCSPDELCSIFILTYVHLSLNLVSKCTCENLVPFYQELGRSHKTGLSVLFYLCYKDWCLSIRNLEGHTRQVWVYYFTFVIRIGAFLPGTKAVVMTRQVWVYYSTFVIRFGAFLPGSWKVTQDRFECIILPLL
jgi:hypothetical protein